MEQRISLITLGVADLERSRSFYERLGWRRSMPQTKDVVFFQAGGMVLALYGRGDLAKDAQLTRAVQYIDDRIAHLNDVNASGGQ